MVMIWEILVPLPQEMQSTPIGEVHRVTSTAGVTVHHPVPHLNIPWQPFSHTPLPCPEFDLDGYRATLDETGLKVADNQGASLENKRALAEKTKGMAQWVCTAAACILLVENTSTPTHYHHMHIMYVFGIDIRPHHHHIDHYHRIQAHNICRSVQGSQQLDTCLSRGG